MATFIKETDFYDRHYELKNHIIIMGCLKPSILASFLMHFYKGLSSNYKTPKCLIIGEQRITPKIKGIL